MLPHIMNGVIVFELWSKYAIFNSFFLKRFVVFVKNDCSNAFALVFWINPDQVEQYIFAIIFRLKKMIKPKRKQFAFCFLQCFRKTWHHDTESYHIPFFIQNKFYVFRVDEADVFLFKIIFLHICNGNKRRQICI